MSFRRTLHAGLFLSGFSTFVGGALALSLLAGAVAPLVGGILFLVGATTITYEMSRW